MPEGLAQRLKNPGPLSVGLAVIAWLCLLVVVYFSDTPTLTGLMRTTVAPPNAPQTVPFDGRLATGSADLPYDSVRVKRAVQGDEPEQIHIALAGVAGMAVSWVTGNATQLFGEAARKAPKEPDVKAARPASMVQYGRESGKLMRTAKGASQRYTQQYSNASYTSGFLHHVKLDHLLPSTRYFYRCGDAAGHMSSELSFMSMSSISPDAFPQRIGIIGDLGQTYNSSSTLDHLIANEPPLAIIVGDFSYSDTYAENGKHLMEDPRVIPTTYQPRWDTWGRLIQPLASKVPFMGLEGNHEIEQDLHGRMFQSFQGRFRFPAEESGSPSQLFYSFDLAGAHIVMLGTYADLDKSSQYAADSPQLKWLRADLAAFDRGRTPWLIVGMHAPWYNTYAAHYKEAECFRLAVEEMLYDAGADMIFAGHVHAYERSNPVYDYQLDDCGATHVTIGDGGNIEGLYTSWVDDPPGSCPDPVSPCVTKQGGRFCPIQQPDWSAYREPSFGHGMLELHNATEATWTWHRNQDGAAVASESVTITRNPSCFNQRIP